MKLKLISLFISPRGENGWTSGRLKFGNYATLIKGGNTTGKTPLMLSIVYALGHQVEFRDDILKHCEHVELEVECNSLMFTIKRAFQKPRNVDIKIYDSTKTQIAEFENEGDFSKWFLKINSINETVLTNKNSAAHASIYTSTLLPCFYVNQDDGWTDLYKSPVNFIKDQRQEMLRTILGISPRNPFELKMDLNKERRNLERISERINNRRSIIKDLNKSFEMRSKLSIVPLENRRKRLISKLNELKGGLTGLSKVSAMHTSQINDLSEETDLLEREVSDYKAREKSQKIISQEIESEIEALSLNVDAADRFRSLCGRSDCILFPDSSATYGKSLLYLKDQLKDLATTIASLKNEHEKNKDKLSANILKLKTLQAKKQEELSSKGFDSFIELIETYSTELVEIETQLSFLRQKNDHENILSNLLNERDKSKERIDALSKTSKGKSDSKTLKAKMILQEKMEEWKKIANVMNVPGETKFDDRFNLYFGTEKLSALKGSTKTRVILSYHAAVLETSLEIDGNHPGILILDTPKQQELKVKDLRKYFVKLHELSKEKNFGLQLCIAFSESDLKPGPNDALWEPKYKVGKRKMYLGNESNIT